MIALLEDTTENPLLSKYIYYGIKCRPRRRREKSNQCLEITDFEARLVGWLVGGGDQFSRPLLIDSHKSVSIVLPNLIS